MSELDELNRFSRPPKPKRKKGVQPIRPEDITTAKAKSLPDAVIEAFNELIIENIGGGRAMIKQEDVVDRIQTKLSIGDEPFSRTEIFDKGYLEVEDVYRHAGWIVEYDKPGFNESYDAFFVFKKKGK